MFVCGEETAQEQFFLSPLRKSTVVSMSRHISVIATNASPGFGDYCFQRLERNLPPAFLATQSCLFFSHLLFRPVCQFLSP